MQQRRKSAFVITAVLLFSVCAGFVWSKSALVVGMVTEAQGHAYWQNDSKKNHVQELAELPENAKLVLAQGSKLIVVYLTSAQQYELNGPALVQFKKDKPVALSGTIPRTIGAAPVSAGKKRIDPKSVQTAGQTLVSTDTKADPGFPVAATAPPPPPAPPPMMAPSPAAPEAIVAAGERERMEAYAAAKRAEEAQMTAARQAEMAARASQIAAMEAAEAAAAQSAEYEKEKRGAEPKLDPECPPPTADDGSGLSEVAKCGDIEN